MKIKKSKWKLGKSCFNLVGPDMSNGGMGTVGDT